MKEKEEQNNLQKRKPREKKKEESYKLNLTRNSNVLKKCSKCKKEKPETEFHLAKNYGKLRSSCIECNKALRKIHYEKNREKIIKQTSQYKVNRMKVDPTFKFIRRQRNRIYSAFISRGLKKTNRTLKYLGCTKEHLQKWITFQLSLQTSMTLANYGKFWHIDHVKPCASFDLSKEEEIAECFNWKNLRPYIASKNIEKRDKIILRAILFHELILNCFVRGRRVRKVICSKYKALL